MSKHSFELGEVIYCRSICFLVLCLVGIPAFGASILVKPNSPTSSDAFTIQISGNAPAGESLLYIPPVTVANGVVHIQGCFVPNPNVSFPGYVAFVNLSNYPAGHYGVEYYSALCDSAGSGNLLSPPVLEATAAFDVTQAPPLSVPTLSILAQSVLIVLPGILGVRRSGVPRNSATKAA